MLSNGRHGRKDRLGELEIKQIAVREAAAKANGELDFAIRRKKRLFADLRGISPALSAFNRNFPKCDSERSAFISLADAAGIF